MKWRLLLDLDALEFLASLTAAEERALRVRLRQIQEWPDRFCDFEEADERGRLLEVNVCSGFEIVYWADLADRHIKVLRIGPAD